MAYAVVRTDKMYGTDVRAGVVSLFVCSSSEDSQAVENGTIVANMGLRTNAYEHIKESEIYIGQVAQDSDDHSNLILVASPEVMYDERMRNLDEFINEAYVPARGYVIHPHDVFSVTKEAFKGGNVPAVQDELGLYDGKLYKKENGSFGTCIGIDVVGRYTYYVIEVK